MKRLLVVLWLSMALCAEAQLTTTQKLIDFQQLASIFAKRYSFLEWKKDAVGFDGLDLRPWMERIAQTKDDVAYLELCAEYVAKFQDSHSGFSLPSDFEADLGFAADIYDGKVLIDSVDRGRLKQAEYPFQIGDELVAIDGRPVKEVMADLAKFLPEGNPRTADRVAAAYLTYRYQSYIPGAHLLGDSATVVVKRRGGSSETYTVPWVKTGTPYSIIGPVPGPVLSGRVAGRDLETSPEAGRWPFYMQHSRKAQVLRSRPIKASLGIADVNPVFTLPSDFVLRVGGGQYDTFISGTMKSGGTNIGYIRLPDFEGYNRTIMDREIKYLSDNTDGLIVDVTRNPGGYACTAESFMRYFVADKFVASGNSVRVTWDWILSLEMDLEYAKELGSPEDVAEIERELAASREAYVKNRGFTEPIPFCSASLELESALDRTGKPLVYSKPVVVVVDDRSASAAEMFAATMQDNQRAVIYGFRTSGAGGAVENMPAGAYSETYASLAWTIIIRKQPIGGTEYPSAPYVENIGVRPDKVADYMTEDNLMNKGVPFVKDLLSATVDYINSKRTQ